MATLFENQTANTVSAKNAELLHNSKISENYRLLRDLEEQQFATIQQERAEAQAHANVLTREQSAVLPRERVTSELFTTETLDRAIRNNVVAEPVVQTIPTQLNSQVVESVAVEEVAVLSSFAKTVAAVFAAVIVMMLTLICINTQIINQKASYLSTLEQKQQELVAKELDLQGKIARQTSKKAIEEFAEKYGMVKED
jgi:outer membrane murein-binding lipoprotein Lpp